MFKNAINNGGAIAAARIDKSGGSVRLVGMGPSASVLNTGRINASAGTATDNGGSINISGTNVTHTGELHADSIGATGGAVHLESSDTTTIGEDGLISVASSGGDGGRAQVLGEQVHLTYNASIDASGETGGGDVLIGGDYQGGNPEIRNADTTFVSSNATVTADAESSGDGGKVIVWADDSTYFYGDISATGGEQSGDGGFAEVSGKENLLYRGHTDLKAPQGQRGTLLLDPVTLTVIDATAGGEEDGNLPTITAASNLGGVVVNTVSWGQIALQGANADVLLQASGLVTVDDVAGMGTAGVTDVVAGEIHLPFDAGGGAGSLTIESTTGNVVFTNTANVIVTEAGNVTILATAGTATVGGIRTSGAADNLSAGAGAVAINSGTGGSIGSIVTDGATATITVGAGTMTQTGLIADSLAPAATVLDKQGAGTLTLSLANTYTGATTVTAGTLNVSNAAGLGTAAAGTTVADGATLNLDLGVGIGAEAITVQGTGVGAAGALQASVAGSAIAGGVTLLGDTSFGGTGGLAFVGVINDGASSFSIEKVGGGTVQLEAANTYDGTTTVTAGTLAVTHQTALGSSGGGVGVDGTTVAADARLTFAIVTPQTVSEELSITGDGPGTSEALLHSTANTLTLDGGITLAGDAVISASAGTGFLNVDGIISGATFGIDKQGAGTVVLNAANTYTGTTTVTLGTLQLGTAGERIADASRLVVNGGTFDMNSLGETVASLAGIGGAVDSAGAAILVSGGDNTSTNFAGSVNGLVALTKIGTGNLTLSGANAYLGVTNVNAGVLTADNNLALGAVGGATIVDGGGDATLAVAAGRDIGTEGLTLNGAGTGNIGALEASGAGAIAGGAITLGGASSLGADAASSLRLDGAITGAVSLSKVGTGTVELNANNAATFTSTIDVTAGTLTASMAGALNINNVNIGMESLTINGAGVSSMGALQGTGLNAEVDGTVTLASAASIGGTGTLQLDGVITSTVVLSKVDSGTLNLTADNSMVGGITGAGSTIAVNGGTLIASNNGALGDTMAGTDVGMGDTLEIAAGIDIGLEALSLDGGTLAANGAGAISSGAISLTADSIVGGAGTLDIFGIISGGFGIDKQDAGNAILHAANAYTGTTTVTAGILRLATAAERIANASDLVVNGGTFDMNGFSETVATLTGVGGIITSAAGTPILNTDGASTYAGNITGTMGLNKTGPGTLTLSGNNTYSGTTTVAAGILQAGSGTAFGDTSDVTLSGGTLDINDQTEVVGSIGGGSGTLHLGAGAGGGDISAAGNIDLTGVTVTTAGGGNDRIDSGMTLTTDAIAKADAGNLNLGGSTLIDLNGTISVSSGSLVLEDATVNAMGDLTANGTLDLSGITLTLDGGSQLIDAGTGALTTDGFTKANAGDVTLGGDGGVDINGAVDVTMGSLILADNANVVGNLDALTNITFQGGGNTTFDGGAINQTVTAMNGTITDTTGVLVKGGANDLILVAGTNVGTGTGNRLGLNVSGGVQASALASNIFMESAVALTINALVTGPGADIVDIRTTAGTASLTMVGGYTAVLGDAFTLLAQGDLNFTTNTRTVATMAASFGQGGGASIDVDVLVDGTTDFTITGGGGVDTIDLAGLAAVFDFTATGAGTGSIDTPVAMGLEVSLYSAIENITSGSAATDSFSDNTAYVITGANTGTASSLNLGAGVWTGIEELFGTAGAADTLSGSTAYVLTGTNAGTATNLTVGWSLIENLVGNINPSDTLSGSDVYTITGADTGTATGTFNITGTWSGIENLFGTAGSGAFNVNNGGSLSGAIADAGGTDVLSYAAKTDANVTVTIEAGFFSAAATAISGGGPSSVLGIEEFVGSGAAGNDTFTGRNEIATWDIDGAGGNETVTDATSTTTYSGFEILQGGSMVDEFDVTDDVTFAELRGGGGNDIFDIDDGPGVGTVVTADLFGEAGDDVVQFGPPGGPPAVGEDSRVVGMVDLGPGAADEIDLSGSELVEIIAITGSDANGNMGTITGFGDPDLISGGFAGVNVLTGNGLGTFIGPPGDTFWDINATDSGTFGGGLGTIGAMVYSGVSILAGAGADTFIFTGTGEVTQGIDGGGGFNTVMGGIGADTFTVLGATSVDFLFGGNTTSLTNITHIDSTAGAGTFDDIGGDTVALGGNTWGGDINGGAGSDTLSGSDNYTITGADLGTSTNVLGAGGWSMIENLDATGGMDTFTVTTGSLSGTADGLGNTDTLTGNATYTISGGDSGTASSVAVWQAIENLTGTGGMDAFNVTTGSLSGTADGLGNTDTLTGNTTYTISGADSGTSSAVGVWTAIENLSGTVGMDTFNVTTGSLSGTADGLGGVTDVLTGNTSYAITGANSGTSSAVAVWTAIENVTGTGGVDMFTFSAAGSLTGSASGLGGGDVYAMNVTSSAASLDGGDGNDMFTIASGVTFSGAVNGDGDNDTLTLTDGTSMLTGSFAGGGTGTDMDVLIGSTGYTISGVDSGTALQVSGTFSEIENLTGTGGMDAFNVTTGSLSGTADGLGNTDTLTGNTTYTISGADSGTSSAVGVWTAIENLSGTVGMDTFTVTTGTLSGTADGLGNTDTLTGNTTYTISGGDSGTSSSVAVWQNIENLTGTGGMDAFNVTTGSLSGTADGLGNTDTLTGNTTYTISGGDSGTASAVGVWTAIENLTGTGGMDTFAVTTGSLSGTADGLGSMDTLSGNTTYTISGGDSGTASSVAVWTAIENLTGTGLDDVFTVTTGTLSGTINGLGPAASDRLEGDTSFTVNGPNAGFSASVAAFINIEDLRATGGADTFNFLAGGSITGDAEGLGAGDTFNIAATSAAVQLIGGAGDDIFNISGGAGTTFTGNIEGGLGSDTLNLGTPTVPPPAGPDRSTIIGDVNLGIEVGETDTIDMSGSDLFQLVDAQDPGMNNEQTGTITGTGPDIGIDMISGTFSGVESFMGNGKGTLIGPNNDTWWQITASDTGTLVRVRNFHGVLSDARLFIRFNLFG